MEKKYKNIAIPSAFIIFFKARIKLAFQNYYEGHLYLSPFPVSRLDDGEYMAFGLSGDERKSRMVGGDVTVAWMDRSSGKYLTLEESQI